MLFRKLSRIALVAMAVGGFTALTVSDANAQASATQSANINAVVANPIVLTKTANLDFGSVTPSTGATTVVINADGTVNPASTAIGRSGVPTAAGFTVSGLALQTYAVTLPGVGTTTLAGPGAPMAVDSFISNATGTISAGGGPDAFGVGATLTVGANQLAGAYSGAFNVTVSYN